MKVDVRPARAADAVRLAELATELGYPASAEEMERRWSALSTRAEHAVFAAELGDRVEGFVHVERVHALTGAPHAEITALVVDAACRSRGLGRALLERAEAWAREQGLDRVALRSRSTRERAHAFYLRAGYAIEKRQLRFVRALGPRP